MNFLRRSHWYEYEFRVRVSVYGSYKLHQWAFMVTCTRTTQRVSIYRQSPEKSNRKK